MLDEFLIKYIPSRIRNTIRAFFRPEKVVFLDRRTTYNQDGLISIMNVDFLNEPHFRDSFSMGAQTGSWGSNPGNVWRIFIACWAAKNCSALAGDFVECGVYKGGLAKTVINYVNFNELNKKFYLFDTFEGLDESQLSQNELDNNLDNQYAHYKVSDVYNDVKSLFKDDKVEVIKGIVPISLNEVAIDKVAFLSIDMNCAAPEVAAIEYFWEKLVPGAIVVFDDYEWPQHEAQRNALNTFARQKQTQILPLPTGQGLIFRT